MPLYEIDSEGNVIKTKFDEETKELLSESGSFLSKINIKIYFQAKTSTFLQHQALPFLLLHVQIHFFPIF